MMEPKQYVFSMSSIAMESCSDKPIIYWVYCTLKPIYNILAYNVFIRYDPIVSWGASINKSWRNCWCIVLLHVGQLMPSVIPAVLSDDLPKKVPDPWHYCSLFIINSFLLILEEFLNVAIAWWYCWMLTLTDMLLFADTGGVPECWYCWVKIWGRWLLMSQHILIFAWFHFMAWKFRLFNQEMLIDYLLHSMLLSETLISYVPICFVN